MSDGQKRTPLELMQTYFIDYEKARSFLYYLLTYRESLYSYESEYALKLRNFAFYADDFIKEVTVPNAIEIGFQAFQHSRSLKAINLTSIQYIRRYAFEYCVELESVTVDDYDKRSYVEIGESAFSMCVKLNDVGLKIKKLGMGAFYGCENLTIVDTELVEIFSQNSFDRCKLLANVDFSSAKQICNEAFNGCKQLTAANLPKCETIGDFAFCDCSKLTTVELANIKSIGDGAFLGCVSLHTLIIRSDTLCSVKPTSFSSCYDMYVYVPRELIEDYKADSNWNYCSFRALEDYTVDGTVTGDLIEGI